MCTPFGGSRPALLSVISSLAASLLLIAPARGAAQEPVRAFDQLSTRLKVGDTVWVTDASGREVKGKITGLGGTSLTLDDGRRTFQDRDVRTILERPHDSLKFGTLLGLGIGAGIGVALTIAAGESDGSPGAIAVLGGMGAGIGALIDALDPMEKRAVYVAQGAAPGGKVSWRPLIGPHSKGVAVSFAF